MHRRKLRSWLAVVTPALAVALALSACGGSSDEQQLIRKYFDASRMGDNTTTGNIALVSFDPKTDGGVQSFSVVSMSEEKRQPLRIKELSAASQAARNQEQEAARLRKEYQTKNLAAIQRVMKAEAERKPPARADETVQAEWMKFRQDMVAYSKKTAEARQAAGALRPAAELSVFDARTPINILEYDGDLISKDVTISANVRTPDGKTAEKQLVVTLQRAELKGATGAPRIGRWVITAVK